MMDEAFAPHSDTPDLQPPRPAAAPAPAPASAPLTAATAAARQPTLRQRLGEAMAHQRNRRGLTQEELARIAQVSTKYLGQIERGEANVTIDVLERLASALGWDPHRLFAIDPPPIDEALRTRLIAALGHLQGSVTTEVRTLVDTLEALSTTARVL